MARTTAVNGHANSHDEKGANGAIAANSTAGSKTDYSRWRLLDENGRQTWQYLETDDQVEKWPQTVADRYHLGLPTGLPDLPPAKTPIQAVENGLTFFKELQLPSGQWACEYGGPMFLLPGLAVTWYVTETEVPEAYKTEIKNYLLARQNPVDGGWGLHIEGESSVFGTAMNYTVMRLLGMDAEDPRMIKARGTLHKMGGATHAPHWAKWWLAVLGVAKWDIVNPVPPELWLLPDWVPIHPWRWWIHMRQVYLPMGFVYSKKWSYKLTPLTESLQKELFVEEYESINWNGHRNSIAPQDNYHPKTWILNTINWILVYIWIPFLRFDWLIKRAEEWAYQLIKFEDENTNYACLAPANAPMNLICAYIEEGPDSFAVKKHREKLADYLWVKNEGMLMNGTNGVQIWDTSFLIQAAVSAGVQNDARWKPMLTKALDFLEKQQMVENPPHYEVAYRQASKGAWAFSTREQGYTVSDCTAEGLKSVLLLQSFSSYPDLVSDERLRWSADLLLTMQNPSGGCASYEPTRGSTKLEWLNAAEVFDRIMVEYDYPECTTAVVTALCAFRKQFPKYRRAEIDAFIERAVGYIRRAQREDGSWYGSWGICFTYAGMFALESLRSVGETYENSERVRRACHFFVERQMEDGGWGESYKSCEDLVWRNHERSQVVQTAWVCIGLMEAEFPDKTVIAKALKMIMSRQQANGEWLQEAIEGVFNNSCMISYPNYKFIFPMKALGMYARKYGDETLL
ncbi:terpenoid cyclases/protein prenyltransferase alpha-alpha toroid [Phyllosticta capitalensis]|uniref:terpenoid cyclases/protein prenyltransferase alpha-alpha toroid n=1 Tax=Phyllosticta capitalensis TaxID=121624 RepID=UPI00312CC465